MIPITEMVNPLYRPATPSDLTTFVRQSTTPLNYLSPAPLPISAPSLVLTKSKGYTNIKEVPPARPPEARF